MPVGGPCTEVSTEVKPKLNPRDFARKEEGLRQVLRDGMGREAGWGIGMGSTCKSMADSCQCMAKTIHTKKKNNKISK